MIKNILKKIDMFNCFDKNEIDILSHITIIETFQNNNIIFYEGEEAQYFYILLEGEVKLYKTNQKSQEVVLHYFSAPSMVAEMATLEDFNFPATCVATQDNTKIGMIKKEEFMGILKNNSDLALHIIKSLTKKIKNLEISINRNLIFDATTKVCSILQENPTILKTHKNVHIANMLNIAPETLSRTISKLKKLEILDENNEVINIKKLNMF